MIGIVCADIERQTFPSVRGKRLHRSHHHHKELRHSDAVKPVESILANEKQTVEKKESTDSSASSKDLSWFKSLLIPKFSESIDTKKMVASAMAEMIGTMVLVMSTYSPDNAPVAIGLALMIMV